MLQGLRVLNRIKRHGLESGYNGVEAQACPYTSPELAQAWHRGWRIGRSNYVRDQRDRKRGEDDTNSRNELA